MEKEVLENHKQYAERNKLYQSYGFNIDEERQFVLEKAKPLFGNILEVGTGKGHFTLTLAKEGYKFTSIDISKTAQDIARLNLQYFGLEKSVNFRIENAESLSFQDASFSIIFSINTIHHLNSPFKVINEFIRILSLEGKIVISDFNDKGFDVLDKIHAKESRIHEKSNISLHDIEEYFTDNGFIVDQYESDFQKMLIAYKQVV